METELTQLHNVLNGLPTMSKGIVDSTRHEKVFSYIQGNITKYGDALYEVLEKWNVVDTLSRCFEENQDFRVTSIGLRVIGQLIDSLVANRETLLEKLFADTSVFTQLWERLIGSEVALLRFASMECLKSLVKSRLGASWLNSSIEFPEIFSNLLYDSSSYVVSSSCEFFIYLVTLPDTPGWSDVHEELLGNLISSMKLLANLSDITNPNGSVHNRVCELELIWSLVHSKHPRSLKLLHDHKMLMNIYALHGDANRVIQTRANEILSTVFEWVPYPLTLLGPADTFEHTTNQQLQLQQTFEYSLAHVVLPLLLSPESFKPLAAISVLDSMGKLVPRDEIHRRKMGQSLIEVLVFLLSLASNQTDEVVVDCLTADQLLEIEQKLHEQFAKGVRVNTNRKAIVLRTLLVLLSVIKSEHNTLQSVDLIDHCLHTLSNSTFNQDQRILKNGLALLHQLFEHLEEQIDDQKLTKVLNELLSILNNPGLSCHGVRLLLDTFKHFLNTPAIGRAVLNSVGERLSDVLESKCYDMNWDVRDTVLEFFGELFNENCQHGIELILSFKLLKMVMEKVADAESYVRASAVQTLGAAVKNQSGWSDLHLHDGIRNLLGKMPDLLCDTEAFVRRAVFDLITCLISSRQYTRLFFSSEAGEEPILSHGLLMRLLDDCDWEVRVRGVKFLYELWMVSWNEQEYRNKRESSAAVNWFFNVKADELLLATIEDSSRLVRGESLSAIRKILKTSAGTGTLQGGKRDIQDTQELAHDQFLEKLRKIDLVRLEESVEVEHLYKEALENDSVDNETMMETDQPNIGNNILECY
ncbi:hypothetical protein K493DRAFT_406815 [Basidiobolus meristosporus CBS 931.73]|uniref:ARM repeat-containing protein n=1 Tax=Basidiobolus meristosporus CBS 931.73 TaxID=1314790 RepID=A0A1Y1YJK8_9FUNG|nr:hypothetical protein K493DRAFT_406815 [Basidiobolus meristosporus CBS 931.73]|eukprot:ORX97784.1 hypothetical protein K493DRAFT_406815 [Basidiobolus meristosporus CBS 931.73]